MTKLYLNEFRHNQFMIEMYAFEEFKYEIRLFNIFNVSQTLTKQLLHDQSFEFVIIKLNFFF